MPKLFVGQNQDLRLDVSTHDVVCRNFMSGSISYCWNVCEHSQSMLLTRVLRKNKRKGRDITIQSMEFSRALSFVIVARLCKTIIFGKRMMLFTM